jgi:hypothetical protein
VGYRPSAEVDLKEIRSECAGCVGDSDQRRVAVNTVKTS